jgi:hypothetical protein
VAVQDHRWNELPKTFIRDHHDHGVYLVVFLDGRCHEVIGRLSLRIIRALVTLYAAGRHYGRGPLLSLWCFGIS